MKIIQASAWYPPDSFGGVEVYLDGLTQNLQAIGVECSVIAPRPNQNLQEQHNGIEVYRYDSFNSFAAWLRFNQADIYHQHTIHSSCGIEHLRWARSLGMSTIATIHMPDLACLRGTMMRGGHSACDGKIDVVRCAQCLGVSKRVPDTMLRSLSHLPSSIATISRTQLRHAPDVRLRQLGTTLSTPAQIAAHRRQFRALIQQVDRVVVVCQWLYDAFVANGVPIEKLILSRHGVDAAPLPATSSESSCFKIGFLGRWQETKGVQILVEALQHVSKSIPIELIIHATHADRYGQANREKVCAIAAHDSRIKIREPLARSEIAQAIAQFDLLAVPSQWLETGPLVVLEAHAAKTPVIGSNLGGIAELVRHGVDGWLVPPIEIEAWTNAISYLATNPAIVAGLRQNIPFVKTTRDVAHEMRSLYSALVREH